MVCQNLKLRCKQLFRERKKVGINHENNLNKEKGVEKQQKLKKTKIKRIVKNRKKMQRNARKKPKINQPK